MKKFLTCAGILIMVIIIGLIVAACGNLSGGGDSDNSSDLPPTDGRLIITGLEAYNNKYVIASGSLENPDMDFIATEDINFSQQYYVGSKISDGKATLKLWAEDDEAENSDTEAYSGNHQNVEFDFFICEERNISALESIPLAEGYVFPVNFDNGISNNNAASYISPTVMVTFENNITSALEVRVDDENMESYIELQSLQYAYAIEGEEDNYAEDFKLFVNDDEIAFDEIDLGEGLKQIQFERDIEDLLVAGESYEIQIIYTANPSRPIKAWIPKNNDEEEPSGSYTTLSSFDTGVKTFIVRNW
jgi:hypothetical protein